MRKLLFLIVCAIVGVSPSFAQYTTITASHIADASGAPLASGVVHFVATDGKGNRIAFRLPDGGQGLVTSVDCNIGNGTIAALCKLADTHLTNPVNLCYQVTITDNVTGDFVQGPGSGYKCYQPTGSSDNFDNFIPNNLSLGPVETGPQGPVGPQGPAGTGCGATNCIIASPTGNQTINQPSGTSLSTNTFNAEVYMQPGQTLANALNQLETVSAGTGGIIHAGLGIWQSAGFVCTVPNVTIIGSGRPSANSGNTALTGGTIIQGTIAANQGCSHFVLKNLGVDVGSAWVAAGNAAADAVSIFNNGQVVGATPLDGVLIDNVIGLGSSLSAAFHAILVENVTNSLIHNVVAILNQHGIVLKGTYSHIDGFYSAGHSVDSVIVKSDVYAPSHDDTVTNGTMHYLSTPGDSLGLIINSEHAGTGIPVQRISVSNVQAYGLANATAGSAFQITGAETFNPAVDITLTDILVDWPGGSPTNVQCVTLAQSTARVNIKGLNCQNVYAGIAFAFPSSGFMGDITLTNSYFANIQTNAVNTYGTWTASNNECNNVTVNCFLNQVGNTALSNNTVISSGAYWNTVSGTMQFDYHAYLTNSQPQTNSPGAVANVEVATSGTLSVTFVHPFNTIVGCQATVISNSATGTTTVPRVWILAEDTTHVIFNTSDVTFNGFISWRCEGQLQ